MPEPRMQETLERHRQSLRELETEITRLTESDYLKENQTLRESEGACRLQKEQAEQKLAQLSAENERLKRALADQLFSERAGLVNRAEQKVESFYRSGNAYEMNRLRALEMQVSQRLSNLRRELNQKQLTGQQELLTELRTFEQHTHQQLTQMRELYAVPAAGAFTAEERAGFEALRQEPLTEEQMAELSRKNNLELFIGQNLINKIGVLLVVIGVIAASQYSLFFLPDIFKGIAMFLLGGLLLAGGEMLNRRRPSVFSLGITAGGVAVLYVATTVSYFGLQILGSLAAVGLCVLITLVSFLLARRYASQTIAAFALIGGYLPLLALGSNLTMFYGAMAYFVLLNLLALLFCVQRRWRFCAFLGFFLNLVGSVYLSANVIYQLWYAQFGIGHVLLLAYLFFTFLIYTAVPVVGVWRTGKHFAIPEVLLLSANTVFSSIILYSAFYTLHLGDYAGALAVLFAVCYLLLGRLIERHFDGERRACVLFYLTGLAFVVLIVPIQFGRVWLSLGWLVEGVALSVYGILRNEKLYKRVGTVICALCGVAFVLFDLLLQVDDLFFWKYLAITLGSLLIFAALHRMKEHGSNAVLYRLGTAINLWIYLLYLTGEEISLAAWGGSSTGLSWVAMLERPLVCCAWAVVTVLMAYLLRHSKLCAERALQTFGVVLYVIACVGTVFTNLLPTVQVQSQSDATMTILATVLLILINLAAIFALRELLAHLALGGRMNAALYPLLFSGFGLFLFTQVLIVQYRVGLSSVFISVVYMLMALAWVIFGFMRRNALLRRFGLGLAVLSVAKLFLIDLHALTAGYRIVSYFALGIALIAISFIYQRFQKKFEQKEVGELRE